MLLCFEALIHVDVSTASISLCRAPVFGVIHAITLFGERSYTPEIIGSLIVLLATVLIVRYDKA